jgi:hypothetical protein
MSAFLFNDHERQKGKEQGLIIFSMKKFDKDVFVKTKIN